MLRLKVVIVILMISFAANAAESDRADKYAVGKQVADIELSLPNIEQRGRYAFIAPKDGYLVEINNKGIVTFSFKIPKSYNRTLRAGADVEYLTVNDRFLVVVPRKGILEIDRSRGIVWSCKTPYVSHDVDLLPDDTLIFVNGWDDENKNEPIYTHMARDCTVLSQLFASDLNLDKSRFRPDNTKKSNPKKTKPQAPSHTHTNAVWTRPDGLLMLSIRNYDEFVLIKDKKVVRRYQGIRRVHDPVPVKLEADIDDMEFYYANHGRWHHIGRTVEEDASSRKNDIVLWTAQSEIRSNQDLWRPLRTIEILPNKNILFSGSAYLAQITSQGELAWKARISGFINQHERGNFIYKAVFVPDF